MGIRNDLDLLITETEEKKDEAKVKYDKGMIEFTQAGGEVKKEK